MHTKATHKKSTQTIHIFPYFWNAGVNSYIKGNKHQHNCISTNRFSVTQLTSNIKFNLLLHQNEKYFGDSTWCGDNITSKWTRSPESIIHCQSALY